MSSWRGSDGEMPRYPIDDSTADRLLTGRLAPEDAPPGCAGLAELIRTSRGPARPDELATEATVVAEMVAAVHSTSVHAADPSRRSHRMTLSKLLSAKVGAIAVTTVLGAGVAAAAATGSVSSTLTHIGVFSPASVTTSTTTSSTSSTTSSTTTSSTTSTTMGTTTTTVAGGTSQGPGPNGSNDFGLCTAFLSGSANGRAHKDNAPPFAALIAAHGGVAGTTTYCQGVVASSSSTTSTTMGGTTTTSTTQAGADSTDSGSGPNSHANSHATDNPGASHHS